MFHESNFLTLVESWPAEHEVLASAFRRAFAGLTEASEASDHVYSTPAFSAVSTMIYNDLAATILDHTRGLDPAGLAEVASLPGFLLAFDDFAAHVHLMPKALHIMLSSPAAREECFSQLRAASFLVGGFSRSTPATAFTINWVVKLNKAHLPRLWPVVKAEIESFVPADSADSSTTRPTPGSFDLSNPDMLSFLSSLFFTDDAAGRALFDELSFFNPFPKLTDDTAFTKFTFSPNAVARYFQASNPRAFASKCVKFGIDDALVAAMLPGWAGSAMEFFVAAQTLAAERS